MDVKVHTFKLYTMTTTFKLRQNGLYWNGYTSAKLDRNGKEFKSMESLQQTLNKLRELKPELHKLLTTDSEIVKFETKETVIVRYENTTDDF